MWRDLVLRQLTEQARKCARARNRSSGNRFRAAGGALDVLLRRRFVLRVLNYVGDLSRSLR